MGVVLSILLGFGSGVVVSGAVFAFIAAIGVVPALASRTKTQEAVVIYEEAIIWGGIFGAATMVFDMRWSLTGALPVVLVIALGLFAGVFFGVLAMCLAEVLDVLPILSRRLGIVRGMSFFVIAIAAGKLIGAIIYFVIGKFGS